MDCKKCADLLAAYKHAISLYTTAQKRFQRPVRDDFELAWQELKGFREACKGADESLLAHWREEHADLAEKAGSS